MTTGSTTTQKPLPPGIVLYDVAFARPREENSCAPNPWKARYALNFKGVPYTTQWVQMLDIKTLRTGLGIPASRKFANGKDYYTLPMLTDSERDVRLGDSFDIAIWAERTWPGEGAGNLFPEELLGQLGYKVPEREKGILPVPLSEPREGESEVQRRLAEFQVHVDTAFTFHVPLMGTGMKWDPEVEADVKAEFGRRAGGVKSIDEIAVTDGEQREMLMENLKGTLKGLAELYLRRKEQGPYLLGSKPSYADCIVGGWLCMMNKTVYEGEWAEVQGWYDGVFGRLHAAMQERFGEVKV